MMMTDCGELLGVPLLLAFLALCWWAYCRLARNRETLTGYSKGRHARAYPYHISGETYGVHAVLYEGKKPVAECNFEANSLGWTMSKHEARCLVEDILNDFVNGRGGKWFAPK